MTPDRWRQVSRIYHDALAQAPSEREAFIRAASGDDAELEREVHSLLAQPSSDGFLNPPVDAGRGPDGPARTGHLGRFELRGLLGAGGMGEVYRAHEASLGRDVALKILPAAFTADRDRAARFEREARVLAALNHPHIAAIYGVEEVPAQPGTDEGVLRALVLELVEGETLADRLQRGRLPLPDTLEIARQVADALDAAHERGIVHRDLKPANIKVRPDGAVKVLDFGLAKAVGLMAMHPDGTTGPAAVTETMDGMIVGTPAYMSPEQARAQPVDTRTDVWAFGCVLYEMIAGRPAFGRETTSDTIAAVLDGEPDISALPPATPPSVRRVIERCLVKDPRKRLRDIGDARADLGDVSNPVTPALAGSRTASRVGPVLPWIVSAIAVSTAVWLGFDRLATPARRDATAGWSLERLSHDAGLTTMPAQSPDGQLIAYASDRAGRGDLDLWVQQAGGGAPLRLTTDPADDHSPQFSPDGKQIVFRSERGGGGVYLVSALGGAERLAVSEGRRPRLSPDGTRLAYWTGHFRGLASESTSQLFVVPLGGGTPAKVAGDFAVARDAVWAPDGRSLLFLGRRDRVRPMAETFDWWWGPLDGRAPVKTGVFGSAPLSDTVPFQVEGSPAAWTADGVLFTARGNLWTVPLSLDDGRPLGAPRRLTNVTGRAEAPSVGPDGSIVLAVTHSQRVIERLALPGGDGDDAPPTRLYADNRGVALRASHTADGSLIVFDQGFGAYHEIWTLDPRTRRQQMVLRVSAGFPVSPTVSADGARIAYSVVTPPESVDNASGYVVEIAGGVPRALCKGCALYGFLSDHHRVLATWDQAQVIGTIDARDGSRAELIREPGGRLDRPHASLDDRWLAFRNRGGGIYVSRLSPGRPSTRDEWQRIDEPTITGRPFGWSLDTRTVYLFLDTDGFRCVWGQRIDARTGRLDGAVFPVRHLHGQMEDGPSTSFGNPITKEGLLYERVLRTGDLWRLVPTSPADDPTYEER